VGKREKKGEEKDGQEVRNLLIRASWCPYHILPLLLLTFSSEEERMKGRKEKGEKRVQLGLIGALFFPALYLLFVLPSRVGMPGTGAGEKKEKGKGGGKRKGHKTRLAVRPRHDPSSPTKGKKRDIAGGDRVRTLHIPLAVTDGPADKKGKKKERIADGKKR